MADKSIRVRGGLTVYPVGLNQWLTYGGLLQGFPTAEINEQLIAELLAGQRRTSGGAEPFLVPPTTRTIDRRGLPPYPGGEPTALPPVVCVMRLHSLEPAQDPKAHYSRLTVVWFQDEYAFPIDPKVLDALQALDWKAVAHDAWN
jgi:hypothetical protein